MVFTEDMCFFDPERDMKPVEPFGFVDLQSAFVNGVIEAQVAETDEDYNGIDNPAVIIGKPRDIFDVMQSKLNLEVAQKAEAAQKENVD